MNPTAGSFIINPRLQRLFMTLAVEFPGQDSLMKIYGTFLTGHLKKFSAEVQVRPMTCSSSATVQVLLHQMSGHVACGAHW